MCPDKAFLYEKLKGREFLKFIASLHGIEKNTALREIATNLPHFSA